MKTTTSLNPVPHLPLASMPSMMHWSVWPAARKDQEHVATNGYTKSGTWQQFCRWVEAQHSEDVTYAKGTGPQWSPTANRDGHRCKLSTQQVDALVYDCDGTGDYQQIVTYCQTHQIAFCVYESPSYTPQTPKWRLVLPLSLPFWTCDRTDPGTESPKVSEAANLIWHRIYEHGRKIVGTLAGLADPGFDATTGDISRIYYLGHRRDVTVPYRKVTWGAGSAIDGGALLASLPVESPRVRQVQPGGTGVVNVLTRDTLPRDYPITLTGGSPETVAFEDVSRKSHCLCPAHGGDGTGTAWADVTASGSQVVCCSKCQKTWRPEPKAIESGFRMFSMASTTSGTENVAKPHESRCGTPFCDEDEESVAPPPSKKEESEEVGCHTYSPNGFRSFQHIEINVPYVTASQEVEDIIKTLHDDDDVLIIVRSPQATGKTTLTQRIAKALHTRHPDASQLSCANRVTLVNDQVRVYGFESYATDPTAQRVVTTLDSLPKVPTYTITEGAVSPRKFSLVILDEVTQGLRHLTGKTIGDDAVRVINHLRVVCQQSRVVLAMDADANTLTLEQLDRIGVAVGKRVIVIENHWRPVGRSALFYSSRPDHLAAFLADLEAGLKPYYTTAGGPKRAATVEKMVHEKFPHVRVGVFSSDTSRTPRVQHDLTDMTAAMSQYDCVIATPTLGTGVDIQIPAGFDVVYVDVPSHDVGADEVLQMARRVRSPRNPEIKVWVQSGKKHWQEDPAKIAEELLSVHNQTRKDLSQAYACSPAIKALDGVTLAPQDDLHFWLYCQTRAYVHEQTNNLLANVEARFAEAGFTLTHIQDTKSKAAKDTAKAFTEASKLVEGERADRISLAVDVTIERAAEIERATVVTADDLDSAVKAGIEDFYGTSATPALVLEDARGKLRPRISSLAVYLLMMAKDTEAAAIRDLKSIQTGLKAQVKGHYRAAKVFQGVLALIYGIKGNVTQHQGVITMPAINPSDPQTANLLALAKTFLGITTRPKTAMIKGTQVTIAPVDSTAFLSALLGKYALGLTSSKVRVGSATIREYSIDTTEAAHRVTLAQAKITKLKDALAKQVADLEMESMTQTSPLSDEDFEALFSNIEHPDSIYVPTDDDDGGDDDDRDPNWGSSDTWHDFDSEGEAARESV